MIFNMFDIYMRKFPKISKTLPRSNSANIEDLLQIIQSEIVPKESQRSCANFSFHVLNIFEGWMG